MNRSLLAITTCAVLVGTLAHDEAHADVIPTGSALDPPPSWVGEPSRSRGRRIEPPPLVVEPFSVPNQTNIPSRRPPPKHYDRRARPGWHDHDRRPGDRRDRPRWDDRD